MTKLILSVAAWLVLVVVLMVGAAYFWVWVYSLLIHTGGDHAHYEAYAKVASPVVAVITAFPVFFLMGRYMRRFGERAVYAAGAVVALNLILDGLTLITVAEDLGYVGMMSALSMILKIAGAWAGLRHRTSDVRPAVG